MKIVAFQLQTTAAARSLYKALNGILQIQMEKKRYCADVQLSRPATKGVPREVVLDCAFRLFSPRRIC
jgi:hypothetical protein